MLAEAAARCARVRCLASVAGFRVPASEACHQTSATRTGDLPKDPYPTRTTGRRRATVQNLSPPSSTQMRALLAFSRSPRQARLMWRASQRTPREAGMSRRAKPVTVMR